MNTQPNAVEPVMWMDADCYEWITGDDSTAELATKHRNASTDAPLYSQATIDALQARIAELSKDAEKHETAILQVKQWAQAYPLSVFPEPDLKKAHEVLKANGMTLDAISAYNMRHVITKVVEIADAALAQPAPLFTAMGLAEPAFPSVKHV